MILLLKSTNTLNQFIKALFVIFMLSGCATVKQVAVEKDITRLLRQSEIFSNQFTGFSLFDLRENKLIAEYNSTLRFTPASNMKLFTMYATMKSFRDSIPGFVYSKTDSNILITPLGDPSFLHKSFDHQPVLTLLSKTNRVKVDLPKEELAPFGPGWAWDDYIYDFQPQRSWWPIYGNTVSVRKMDDSLLVTPKFFEDYVEVLDQEKPGELVARDLRFNLFKAYLESDTSNFERIIPIEYSSELLSKLLADTLQAEITLNDGFILNQGDTLFTQHVDTILSKMLKPSDNFLAEQLLILSAHQHGYKEIKPFTEHIRNTWLVSLNDIVWKDGSGLSRYNLVAPVDMVRLLKNLHDEFGWDRVTQLLPKGGEGTLKELYISDEPYIFAKTGTLSNNHSLSGYLVTKSGKRLVFSLMSNHYIRPSQEVKKAMESFLIEVKEAY